MSIRHADPTDLASIVAIYNESIASRTATADDVPISVGSRKKWFADHSPYTYPIFVFEEAGRIVGWTSLSPFYGRPAYRATAEVSTYVSESWRGKGIGKALRKHAIDYCPTIGIRVLVSFVFADNAVSIGLNRKFGFSEWGRLPAVAILDGIAKDLLVMGLHLTPPR